MKRKNFKQIWRLPVFLLVVMLVLAGCRRGSSSDIAEINLDLVILPDPPAVGFATVSLILTDVDNQPISGAEIELEGNMNHAGMVPVFSQATETEPGRYEAPLEFTMGGDWFILVNTTLPDGRSFERQINVPGVEAR